MFIIYENISLLLLPLSLLLSNFFGTKTAMLFLSLQQHQKSTRALSIATALGFVRALYEGPSPELHPASFPSTKPHPLTASSLPRNHTPCPQALFCL